MTILSGDIQSWVVAPIFWKVSENGKVDWFWDLLHTMANTSPKTIIIFLVGFGWSTRIGIFSCNNSEINFQQTRWKYHGEINVGIYNQRQYGSWYILWFFRSEKFQRSGRQFCLKVNELIIFITGIAEEYFHPLLIVNSQT